MLMPGSLLRALGRSSTERDLKIISGEVKSRDQVCGEHLVYAHQFGPAVQKPSGCCTLVPLNDGSDARLADNNSGLINEHI